MCTLSFQFSCTPTHIETCRSCTTCSVIAWLPGCRLCVCLGDCPSAGRRFRVDDRARGCGCGEAQDDSDLYERDVENDSPVCAGLTKFAGHLLWLSASLLAIRGWLRGSSPALLRTLSFSSSRVCQYRWYLAVSPCILDWTGWMRQGLHVHSASWPEWWYVGAS